MIKKVKKTFWLHITKPFIFVFGIMLLLSLLVSWGIESSRRKADINQMQYFAVSKSNKIVEAIVGLLYKAEALSALVIQGDGEIKDFERIAAILITDPAIKNVLIAPDGIVTKVYPTSYNEEVVGFNLLGKGDGNKEAIQAKQTGRLTLGGPFNLVQGGQALVGRLPVYIANQGKRVFWGLVSVTLSYPEALSSVYLEDIDRLGYASEIWRISPDTNHKQVILKSSNEVLQDVVERSFQLLNACWTISIAPVNSWYKMIIVLSYMLFSVFVSILVAMLAQNYCDTKKMKIKMEEMAMRDTLTGLPNRRYLFQKLDEMIEECEQLSDGFVLAYIDLNDFKNINDTYGHQAGDIVLKETAKRLQCSLKTDQIAARVGGDEFIVLMKSSESQVILDRIEQEMKNAIFINNTKILVSFSVGLSTYPKDGTTIEALTAHADASMYSTKKNSRHLRNNDFI